VGLRRYLATDGQVGFCPEWYPLFRAANYCHISPMQMLKESIWWKDKALIALNAEAGAQKIIDHH
jgi:hypothetical protein